MRYPPYFSQLQMLFLGADNVPTLRNGFVGAGEGLPAPRNRFKKQKSRPASHRELPRAVAAARTTARISGHCCLELLMLRPHAAPLLKMVARTMYFRGGLTATVTLLLFRNGSKIDPPLKIDGTSYKSFYSSIYHSHTFQPHTC